MVIEKFSRGVREGLTSKVAFELEPEGDEKATYLVIWSRASTLHPSESTILILFSVDLCSPQPAQRYMRSLVFLWDT